MGLDEWVAAQLAEGKHVASEFWFLEPTRTNVRVGLQLDLPKPHKIDEFLQRVQNPYHLTSGMVICLDTRRDVDVKVLHKLINAQKVQANQPMVVYAKGPYVQELRLELNYVNDEDRQHEVSFESLRLLTFPHSRDSREWQQFDLYSRPPYNFRLPGFDEELDYQTVKFGKDVYASCSDSKYSRNFTDAANAIAFLASREVDDVFGLIEELRRVASTFGSRGSDSEIELDVVRV